jgi:paraquat-inducible protein A
MPASTLIACECCDLLRRRPRNGMERTLALALASSVLFIVANSFPFLAFDMKGLSTQTTLLTGVIDLWQAGKQEIAALVFLTIELAPALQIGLILWVLGPLRFGQRPWQLPHAFRMLRHAQTWSMLEVFLIGILVAIVKLLGMATVVPGLALWSFILLIGVLTAAISSFDPEEVWEQLEAGP